MIITRTPLRISFFGGGTDFPEYYESHGGAVIAAAVDRYCYINASRFPSRLFDYAVRVSYSRGELVKAVADLEHPVFRSCLEHAGVLSDIELHAILDLPAFTGLGSSSAFTVGLLHALHAFRGARVTPSLLATEAIHIERTVLGECVGCQDQLLAAHGGFVHIEFGNDPLPKISQLRISAQNLSRLQEHVLLVFTKVKRRAHEIEKTKVPGMKVGSPAFSALQQITAAALELLETTGELDVSALGSLLDAGWREKRRLSPAVSSGLIDDMYSTGMAQGAYGGKLLGAGGGGFLMFLAPPDSHDRIRSAFAENECQQMQLGVPGSQVIFREVAHEGRGRL
jgi:D-glycero-alpha-D-manno-heptose-7-phosphate kinase